VLHDLPVTGAAHHDPYQRFFHVAPPADFTSAILAYPVPVPAAIARCEARPRLLEFKRLKKRMRPPVAASDFNPLPGLPARSRPFLRDPIRDTRRATRCGAGSD
jgi:hypothetical protein